jgi:hypothetical protein
MQELNNKAVSLLPEENRAKIYNLLKKFSDIWKD